MYPTLCGFGLLRQDKSAPHEQGWNDLQSVFTCLFLCLLWTRALTPYLHGVSEHQFCSISSGQSIAACGNIRDLGPLADTRFPLAVDFGLLRLPYQHSQHMRAHRRAD